MRRIIFFFAVFATNILCGSFSFGQASIITTVAGCYSCIATTSDGVPATTAKFSNAAGIALDASKNVYIADYGYNNVRRVLSATNLIYTYAGTGIAGFSGDGGPATNAKLNYPVGICMDAANNLYIADKNNSRIRKVDALTGNISTIAGGGSSTLDGVPATDANILNPVCVYVDAVGNIYTGADYIFGGGGYSLRKIDGITGLITTIAGNGTYGDIGDGGPATSAEIAGPIKNITMDAANNIYIVSNTRNRIRKIDALTGIINTVAGGGTCIEDGTAATLTLLGDIGDDAIDPLGNILIADEGDTLISVVDVATQNIYTIAGEGLSTAEREPALSAYVNNYRIFLDNSGGDIYYTDSAHWIRKMTYSPLPHSGLGSVTDSFSATINKLCTGLQISVTTHRFYSGMSLTTWFGDGQSNATPISGTYCGSGEGYAIINHNYANAGKYTIKQVLYIGTAAIDSMHQTYQQLFCNSLKLNFYFDANGDCIKEDSDPFISLPVLTEVDSNGIIIDTLSATSGLYYSAYGNPGDIYSFKLIQYPGGLLPSCPATGIVSDTLQTGVYNTNTNNIGFICGGISGFDLSVNPVIPVTGIHDQWGNIYVNNSYCNGGSTTASVTIFFSSKYVPDYLGYYDIHPAPSSTTANSITWNSLIISANDPQPVDLYYAIWDNPATGPLIPGDTVHTYVVITPMLGDADTSNNTVEILDTVKAGVDPNEMSVTPSSCVPVGTTQLQYTINFENTGNDTAFNIYVMDTLSNNVNPQSMRIAMASAQMDASVIKNGGYNILKFDFPNINLLDSSHHGLCDGAVIFNINLNSGLVAGTQVFNHAGIFFDDNAVVLTNTVENIINCGALSIPSISNNQNVAIYPNPATDELFIQMNKDAYNACTITNSIGQVLLQQQLTNAQTTINVKSLPAGLYYITLRGDNGIKVQKFVKM